MLVRDVMTAQVVTLTRGQSLPLAGELMKLQRVRHLPVVDTQGQLVGLVTHRDLLEASLSNLSPLSRDERDELQHRVPVASVMRAEVWTVEPHTRLVAAVAIMRDERIGCLCVVEDGKLVGIVTEADVIGVAAEALSLTGPQGPFVAPRTAVHEVMTAAPQVVQASQPVHVVRDLMNKLAVRHLPVLIADELYGVVSKSDVDVACAAHPDPAKVPVGTICTGPAFAVDQEARLDAVAFDLANKKVGSALVMKQGALVGIVTTTDVCRALGQQLQARPE